MSDDGNKNNELEESIINVSDAKSRLSALLEEVALGRQLILGKAGKPMAVLAPYSPKKKKRTPNVLKGQITLSDDFEFSNKELDDLFGI